MPLLLVRSAMLLFLIFGNCVWLRDLSGVVLEWVLLGDRVRPRDASAVHFLHKCGTRSSTQSPGPQMLDQLLELGLTLDMGFHDPSLVLDFGECVLEEDLHV